MLNRFLKAWDHFWFTPQKLVSLACVRIVLVGTMFHLYFQRSWNIIYFTDQWFVPRSQALPMMDEVLRPHWGWFFWPDSSAYLFHGLFVLFLFLLLLGVGGRIVALLAWALHMGFLQRNAGVVFGADVISAVFLFYLALSDSCARLSVLNLFRKSQPIRVDSDILSSVMMRLMQFQICIIYAYTGFEKLKGSSWWEGTALWTVLGNPQMVTMDWSFLRNIPLVVVVGSFVSIIFEIYFPAAMMNKKWRKPWLALGVFFHLTIGLTMGLMHFSLFMISTYFLFLESEMIERSLTYIKKKISWSQSEIK